MWARAETHLTLDVTTPESSYIRAAGNWHIQLPVSEVKTLNPGPGATGPARGHCVGRQGQQEPATLQPHSSVKPGGRGRCPLRMLRKGLRSEEPHFYKMKQIIYLSGQLSQNLLYPCVEFIISWTSKNKNNSIAVYGPKWET